MKTRWWLLTLAFVFAAGWFGGRISSSSPEAGATLQQEAGTTTRSRDSIASAPRESSSKRLAEKLDHAGDEELSSIFREIPAKNRGAALDAWLAAPGNRVLDPEKMERFWKMLDAWVAEDADAAVAWADAQGDPALRELATIGVAGSLASKDPKRAFECLAAHGEFKTGTFDSRFSSFMSQLSEEALKEGPAALAELWKRFPDFTGSADVRYGFRLNCPPGTDFRVLHEAMQGPDGYTTKKPVFLSGISEAWIKQDPAGATTYLAEKIAARETVSQAYQEMYYLQKNQVGSAAADQWVCSMLKDLPADARGKFLLESDFLCSDGRAVEFVRNPEIAGWISDTLPFAAKSGNWAIERILGPLPDEQKIEYLKTLRGTPALQSVNPAMETWKFSESQRAEVLEAIEGK
jgi:hypothetical protein